MSMAIMTTIPRVALIFMVPARDAPRGKPNDRERDPVRKLGSGLTLLDEDELRSMRFGGLGRISDVSKRVLRVKIQPNCDPCSFRRQVPGLVTQCQECWSEKGAAEGAAPATAASCHAEQARLPILLIMLCRSMIMLYWACWLEPIGQCSR